MVAAAWPSWTICESPTHDQTSKLKAARISELDDPAFNTFVNLLESSQANILHPFGAAILPLLDSITCFTVHPAQPCKLEKIDHQDIVSKAKGSDALLRLVS